MGDQRDEVARSIHAVIEDGEWSDTDELETLLVDAISALSESRKS